MTCQCVHDEACEVCGDEKMRLLAESQKHAVVRALGSVPSGHLYAHVAGHLSLTQYQLAVDSLVSTGIISLSDNVLTWVGPKE